MNLDIQFKLKSNPLYIKYLREHSYWYKILIRDPNRFKDFIEKMKEDYHMRPQDKIDRVLTTIDLVSNLISNMI